MRQQIFWNGRSQVWARNTKTDETPPEVGWFVPSTADAFEQGVRMEKALAVADTTPRSFCFSKMHFSKMHFSKMHFSKILQIFGGLVLGCIKTKFCKKICV